ncbi:MAG: carbohydrate binding family 9 domain-containing protein [Phycisphaerae bacterium]|nr:carbohydrate binding family 9 domain-containing protein [Saprospiraceae bacterium]
MKLKHLLFALPAKVLTTVGLPAKVLMTSGLPAIILTTAGLFLTNQFAFGQMGPTNDSNRKTANAVRTEKPPRLDGELDDECWETAPVMTDFITNSPNFGNPAAEKTEVRLVYTDEAIYVGAFLYQPGKTIRHDLSARDAESTADALHVAFDTYLDRQNAFRFQISASNVQSDLKMSPENADPTWDAVWDSKTKTHADGWVVELRIPFSAIRFAKQPEQHWGLQIARQIQYVNEFSTWSPVDPNGGGSLPQWGDLEGIKAIDPPLRLAFSPYLAASLQRDPLLNEDPVKYTNSRSLSGGLDVKWGLSESFTLDATLVPNFGEAQSDNIVRNLSPFEVQYEERRQFFTEGTELFGKGGLLYSRRIGGRPHRFFEAIHAVGDSDVLVQNPSQSQLYNATKLSGRTKSKLGIGILNAVSAPCNAIIRNELTGEERKYQTSELTNYNVIVLDQALPHNSALSFTNTSVMREGVARDANVSAIAFNLRDQGNRYEVFGNGLFSAVFNPAHVTAEKPSTGFGYNIGARKVSGAWTGQLAHWAVNDTYDPSDLGYIGRDNFYRWLGVINHCNYTQRGNIASTFFFINATNTWLYAPRQWESLEIEGFYELVNSKRQSFSLYMTTKPIWFYDYFEPRVWGKKYFHAPYIFFAPSFSTNSSKRLFASFELFYGESPIPNDPYIGVEVEPTWVVNDHLRLSLDLNLTKDHSNFGAVNSDNPADIIFGRRNITTFDNAFAVEYLFGPRMNITARARHYWANLYYHQYLHLNDDGTFNPSDWQGSADENFNQFNVDFVYTWQFAPGSFLNLIWKESAFAGDYDRGGTFSRNLDKTFHAPQNNSLTLKLIYWLDAGKWGARKKK